MRSLRCSSGSYGAPGDCNDDRADTFANDYDDRSPAPAPADDPSTTSADHGGVRELSSPH
ncbi:MAG: hypothetical protein WAL61_14910 [Acidimicrobiales bacterium]